MEMSSRSFRLQVAILVTEKTALQWWGEKQQIRVCFLCGITYFTKSGGLGFPVLLFLDFVCGLFGRISVSLTTVHTRVLVLHSCHSLSSIFHRTQASQAFKADAAKLLGAGFFFSRAAARALNLCSYCRTIVFARAASGISVPRILMARERPW